MKKRKKLPHLTPLILGACLLTFVSCGSDDDDDGGTQAPPQQEEQQTGTFRTILTPLNSNVSGLITGTAEVLYEGDTFEVKINVTGAPEAAHPQFIYLGTSCPETPADANQDSFIDGIEAQSTAGKILIPLDDELIAQSAGGNFPSGANYQYSESTSFLAMFGELKLPDDNATDSITKLGINDDINLAGKVIIIHGVPSTTNLPETVRGVDGASAQETLPIACGVLERQP